MHLPFCAKRCHYCDFVISVANDTGSHERFFEALEKEIQHYASGFQNRRFDTLYLGGGTPSLLSSDEMRRLFSLLKSNFTFKEDAEITCEMNPESLDAEKIALYRKLGINRVSLGAQSFHDKTLKALNRTHTSADTIQSFNLLRKAGFQNISVDLILSLPEESLEEVKHSLDQVVSLNPEHVSLYELTLEKGTVFQREFERGTLKLPAETLQKEMLIFARDYLQAKGFKHYELLSYAKKGFESRHNLLYWANEEYLGLGPGAYSYIEGRRYRYVSSVSEYLRKIEKEDWGLAEEELLSAFKKEVETFLLRLRLEGGASVEMFKPVLDAMPEETKDLEAKGWLERKNGHIRLTEEGQLFAETVFSQLSGV